MRSFDNWQVLFDSNGNPLYGRATFYKLHTTEMLPIYNEDGTVPLQNPMPTSQRGLTDVQVFLQDQDYTVKLERWIGAGDMILDDPNSEDWEEVRTFDNLYPAILVETPDGQPSIVELSTMDALRHLDIRTAPDVNYVKLLGYYSLGDMPPQYYKLETNSNPSIIDDGGSVIRPDGSTNKIWRLIPQENIDVRVFGVFSSPSIEALTAYNSQLHYCFQYANNLGKDVYMPQRFNGRGYYFIEGGTHSLWQKLVADKGVQIVAKPLTTSRLQLGGIQFYGNELFVSTGSYGTLYVDCPEVRTSWKCDSWTEWSGEISKIIVDSLSSSFTFDDVTVEFLNTIDGGKTLTFNNCLIQSDEKIKDCTVTFNDCGDVTDKWLSTGNTIYLSGNRINLKNFNSANTYVEWKNKQLEANYGDLGEQTISNVTLLANAIAENGVFTDVTISGNTELHNISGTMLLNNGSAISLNAVDCWITINGANPVIGTLALRRGALSAPNGLQVLTNLLLDGVELNAALTTLGAQAEIRNSTINASGSITGIDITLYRNLILGTVYQRDNAGTLTASVVDNIFDGNGRCVYSATTSGTRFRDSKWINNTGRGNIPPLSFDLTNIVNSDWSHAYIYEGNKGSFLERYPKIVTAIMNFKVWPYAGRYGSATYPATVPMLIESEHIVPTSRMEFCNGIWIPPEWEPGTTMKIFTIGKLNFAKFKITFAFKFQGSSETYESGSQIDHFYEFTGVESVAVEDPTNYDMKSFNGKMVGNFTFLPRSYTKPPKYNDASTYSVDLTYERIQ